MLANAKSTGVASTLTVAERWLLAATSSDRVWLATSVCDPTAAVPVFQLKERVVPAPGVSPVTVCVPIVTPPAVASVRTTLKLLLIFVPPMFWRVTLMVAVLPLPIDAGALMHVAAPSLAGAFTETVTELWLLAVLPSG